MFCKVYRLRSQGEKLPPDAVKAGVVAGQLLAWISPVPPAMLYVVLRDDRGYGVIQPLHDARLVKLKERGLLFAGTESTFEGPSVDLRTVRYRQTWWCEPTG